MRRSTLGRTLLLGGLAGGSLLAGPCGMTTLQMKDFLTSAVIRTGVTTLASVIESATVDAATADATTQDDEQNQ